MNQNLQLYSLATPNGQKIGIALEEMRIPYDAHTINILKGEQFADEFLEINPNAKIPAIVDPGANHGKDFAVFESGAILVYLAEKSKKFLPEDPFSRSEALQWLYFQVGGVGPMFGQFGHFYKYAKDQCDHPYPVERYTNETRRLLKVIDSRLERAPYLAGSELSVADFATLPWVVGLDTFYHASDLLEMKKLSHLQRWINELLARPAFKIGMNVCPLPTY